MVCHSVLMNIKGEGLNVTPSLIQKILARMTENFKYYCVCKI